MARKKKTARKKTTAKRPAARTTKKKTVKKKAARKSAPKKKVAKKKATKKRATKRPAAKKRVAKKRATKRPAAKKKVAKKKVAKKTIARRKSVVTTRGASIEGQTPLRVHRDIGAKVAALPRGAQAPTPASTLRRGRRGDFAPEPHAELKMPVKLTTVQPIRPTRIRTRRVAGGA